MLLVKGCVVKGCGGSLAFGLFVIGKAVDDTSLQKVFLDYFGNILHGNLAVEGAFGIDYHNRAESAKSETSGLYDLYLIFKSCGLKLHFQSLCKLSASR